MSMAKKNKTITSFFKRRDDEQEQGISNQEAVKRQKTSTSQPNEAVNESVNVPVNEAVNEHYYRVDVFTSTVDQQLHELNSRFNEQAVELLSLSATLCSKNINVEHIVLLVEKYYPKDFTEHERNQLRYQLETFMVERINNPKLSEASSLSALCKALVETQKNGMYELVERVCRLILTLPVSTATTERGFSAMKIIKNRLRNKMSDDYLSNSMVIYIEKEIAQSIDSESIIEEFKNIKGRRAEL